MKVARVVPCYVDAFFPAVGIATLERLERLGFARQRPFVRMSLGATEAPRLGTGMFVLAGPEFG